MRRVQFDRMFGCIKSLRVLGEWFLLLDYVGDSFDHVADVAREQRQRQENDGGDDGEDDGVLGHRLAFLPCRSPGGERLRVGGELQHAGLFLVVAWPRRRTVQAATTSVVPACRFIPLVSGCRGWRRCGEAPLGTSTGRLDYCLGYPDVDRGSWPCRVHDV